MPILPVKKLGEIGVITDINPYDLPLNALSMGNNVRFEDGKIKRANVFRSVLNTTSVTPVFSFTIEAGNDYDKIGIADKNGKVWMLQNGIEDEITETTWSATNSDDPYTFTSIQGIGYLNRPDHVPWYIGSSSTDFAKLTNWNSTWRCASLRAFKDYLIALNVTKGANNYPNMVKWSDVVQYGMIPGSWDETDTTVSAGENYLSEMQSAIVDGLPLRDVFVIYNKDQVWMMEQTGDSFVFRFRKLFDGYGAINTNCIVEVDGRHYVFGPNDIYVHDGNSVQSIIEGYNWEYVFQNMNKLQTKKFWTFHNSFTSEIIFAYISGDAEASFSGTPYCNRAAVFNYKSNAWSFVDLPNAGRPTIANFSIGTTWASAPGTWDGFGGSWYDQEVSGSDAVFMPGVASTANGLTASRLYGYERANDGVLPYSISSEATKKAYVERIAIDLDDVGEQIRAYKVIKAIYPQATIRQDNETIDFKFAGVTYSGQNVTWTTASSFRPDTMYKIDTRESGRYLAWRMETNDLNDFELADFEIDLVTTGRR